jgi:hypothetical protein
MVAMKEENKKEFLELPLFINRGKPPYDDSEPIEVKKSPILTMKGKVVVISLSVLLVSILIFIL